MCRRDCHDCVSWDVQCGDGAVTHCFVDVTIKWEC